MDSDHGVVPKVPEISKEECEVIVKSKLNSNDFNIIKYQLVPVEEKTGFLGEHCHLNITVNHNNQIEELYCFAKFIPDTQSQIDFVLSSGAFRKEIFLYEVMFQKFKELGINYLQSCVAECFFTKKEYVLVFEDITKRGFKPLPKCQYLDYDHVLIVINSLAKLHASSLIFEEKLSEKHGKKYRIFDEYSQYLYETFYNNEKDHKGADGVYASAKGLVSQINLFPDENSKISDEEFKRRAEKACIELFNLVKPSKKYRNVICHGDIWATNFMMTYENNKPNECILVDFQTARYKPPGHDVTSFLYLTTSREFREQHFTKIQEIYYTKLTYLLSEYGYDIKIILPKDEFLKSCEEERLFAAVQTATYVQLTHIKAEYITEFWKDNARWYEALYVDRSIMVLENCKKDPEYKKVMKETLKDLRDVCEETEL